MNTGIDIDFFKKSPIVEHVICSFASTERGIGRLFVVTNVITKEVSFKVEGNSVIKTTNDLEEAVMFYNLLT
jgi:hypothetical protein